MPDWDVCKMFNGNQWPGIIFQQAKDQGNEYDPMRGHNGCYEGATCLIIN